MVSLCTSSTNGYESIGEPKSQQIYDSENDQILCHIFAYKKSNCRSFFYHLFSILLAFIPYIVFRAYPRFKAQFKYKQCHIEIAEIFLVCDNHNKCTIQQVGVTSVNLPHFGLRGTVKYFFHQRTKYVWVPATNSFGTLNQLLWSQKTCDDYVENTEVLSNSEYLELFNLYGPNKIEVEVKTYWRLFVEEIFNPFYMFQAFSIALWCFDDYFIYALCVIILTLFSSITSLIQTRKQSESLHDIVESSRCHEVAVLRELYRGETCMKINPEQLVPGDLIVMPASNFIMPCDAVLLTGQAIVNESVLTGESVPVTKTSLHSGTEAYSTNTHKRHTLFSGTDILQTRYYGGESVIARVVRTGFDTTKGHLVKSILFPSPVNLQFHKDAFKFVFVLFIIAFIGMFYCLYLYLLREAPLKEILVRALDIITIVVPPALPAAMAVGTVYSQNRLKQLKIFCISPPRINVCGKIKLACFDKTGTLTHDGLSMNSVIPCNDAQFFDPVTDIAELEVQSEFVRGMATCHSLTRIEGQLNGDPLDLNMFEFTKWKIEEPGMVETNRFDMLAPTVVMPAKRPTKLKLAHDEKEFCAQDTQIGIIREFSFSSTLQCMSVICKDLVSPNMFAYTKGAPEKLFALCIPDTLPKDFQTRLSFYTARGYRVIALAHKNLPTKFKWKDAQKAKRDKIECNLHFLGLLILQNPLKDETVPVITQLHQANIRTVMITGDNIMTAISVARDCGMVDAYADIYILEVTESEDEAPELLVKKAGSGAQPDIAVIEIYNQHCHIAMDGKTWGKLRTYYEHLIPNLLVRGTIFARFQPDQKTQLVVALQELDYVVSMVGDGANDCGALKAAHVGVSLSPAEASVAAPFTSGIPNISCLIWLILEGRCALVTSFAIFKYMALYSLIQFTTILILYTCHSILGDFQFLFIDLIITTTLAVTMGRQGPSKILGAKRPMSSLVSPKNLVPLILQIVACAFFQLAALYYLYQQKWFEPIPDQGQDEIVVSWENTVLFTVSCYQYVILAWQFSKGKPFRKSVLTNFWFILNVVSLTAFVTWMMLSPCKKIAEIMELMPYKDLEQRSFRYLLVLFPVAHFLASGFIEMFMSDRVWLKKLFQCVSCKTRPKNKYKRLLRDNEFVNYFNSLQISR
ncbi:unnamed protein product [Ceutorhynchus assimilis]|uniref:Cation-transporting ATPase n=1 Tax=Ceutorhynchus assimilis TaxID=467358 RepID=A0A9N9MLN6_9CUCU|nr:unnamed protein product [Ceutorhynchus assimilis]